MASYVLRIYGAKIKEIFRLKDGEEFADFDESFLKSHRPIHKTSQSVFSGEQWSVLIDVNNDFDKRGLIICQHRRAKKQQEFSCKDGTLILRDLGEPFSGKKRYRATLRSVRFKPYVAENYLISMVHPQNPNHNYRGEFSAQPDYQAACFVFSDGEVTAKYRDPNFQGFEDYDDLEIYEGPVVYTVESASWVVACRGHSAKGKKEASWGVSLWTNRPNMYSILPELDRCLEENYFGNFFDPLVPWWSIG